MNVTTKSLSKVPRIIHIVSACKSDLKKAKSNKKCDYALLKTVITKIANRQALDAKHLDHPLQGRYPRKTGHTDCRECHVCNDWLLIYRFPDDDSVHFIRTGTHSELFAAKPK